MGLFPDLLAKNSLDFKANKAKYSYPPFEELKIDPIIQPLFYKEYCIDYEREFLFGSPLYGDSKRFISNLLFLNTNVKEIKKNQEVFKFFMDNKNLRKRVLDHRIARSDFRGISYSSSGMEDHEKYEATLEDLKRFSKFIKELCPMIKEADSSRIKSFYSSIKKFNDGKLKSVDSLIEKCEQDIEEFFIQLKIPMEKKKNKLDIFSENIECRMYIKKDDELTETIKYDDNLCHGGANYSSSLADKIYTELKRDYELEFRGYRPSCIEDKFSRLLERIDDALVAKAKHDREKLVEMKKKLSDIKRKNPSTDEICDLEKMIDDRENELVAISKKSDSNGYSSKIREGHISVSYNAKNESINFCIETKEGKLKEYKIESGDKKIKEAGRNAVIKWHYENNLEKLHQELMGSFSYNYNELAYLSVVGAVFEHFKKMDYHVVFPKLSSKEKNCAKIKNAYYPSLAFNNNDISRNNLFYHKKGKGWEHEIKKINQIVPNDFEYSKDNNVVLITGPNRGGKSVFLNTIGQLHVFAQAGWPIVAEEVAISVKDSIIVPEPEAHKSFKHESLLEDWINAVKNLCERIGGQYDLVLLDELYRGASPQDGSALSHGAIEVLSKTGSLVLLISHYHDLIESTKNMPFMQYLKADSRKEGDNIIYNYKIKPGNSMTSEGLCLARELKGNTEGLMKILEESGKIIR